MVFKAHSGYQVELPGFEYNTNKIIYIIKIIIRPIEHMQNVVILFLPHILLDVLKCLILC